MSDGRAKRDSGDLKGALQAFQAADALMHVPTTSLEVAKTEFMLGLLIEAREEALQIARSPTKPGEPPPFAEARASAQKLADDVEPRIPSIRLVMKSVPEAMMVSIDGVVLPTVSIGLPRRLDPGAHVIVAKVGVAEKRFTIQVLEREAKDVPIDVGDAGQTTPNTTPNITTVPTTNTTTVTTTTPLTTPVDTGASGKGPWVAVGVVTLAVGGIGLVVGGITGAMSLSQTSTIKSQCPANVCPPTLSDGSNTQTALGNARTLGIVSDVTFIAGGVVAAAGIVFMIAGSGKKAAPIALHVGPGSFALAGKF